MSVVSDYVVAVPTGMKHTVAGVGFYPLFQYTVYPVYLFLECGGGEFFFDSFVWVVEYDYVCIVSCY